MKDTLKECEALLLLLLLPCTSCRSNQATGGDIMSLRNRSFFFLCTMYMFLSFLLLSCLFTLHNTHVTNVILGVDHIHKNRILSLISLLAISLIFPRRHAYQQTLLLGNGRLSFAIHYNYYFPSRKNAGLHISPDDYFYLQNFIYVHGCIFFFFLDIR